MPDIFFSYAHEDLDRIHHIVSALEEQGLTVFWDRRIPAGQTWRSYIGKALDEGKCLIVAWSRNSVTSNWVIEEADEGKRRGVLVPLMLDQVEPPRGFREIQAADLTDWQPGQSSTPFNQFLEDIKSVLGAPPSPPKPDVLKVPVKPISTGTGTAGGKWLLTYGIGLLILTLIIVVGYLGYQHWFGVKSIRSTEKGEPVHPKQLPTTEPRKISGEASPPQETTDLPQPPTTKILVHRQGPFHLGDENISGWPPLHGDCFEVAFSIDLPVKKLDLNLQTLGVEKSVIYLNGRVAGSLPEQVKGTGDMRPNYWSNVLSIPLETNLLIAGSNNLKICALPVPNPEFPGDKDDFQIKNVKIVVVK